MDDLWYKRYPALFDGGTIGWPLAARGAYSCLIDYYMLTGQPLPDSDEALASILRVPLDTWMEVAPRVRTKFEKHPEKPQKLIQKRCEEEIEKQRRNTTIWGSNGKKGGRPKGAKDKAKRKAKPNNNPAGSKRDAGGLQKEREKERSTTSKEAVGVFEKIRAVEEQLWLLLEIGTDDSVDLSRIPIWLEKGFDPEGDIYPAIRKVMARGNGRPSSLTYLDGPIADQHEQRLRPVGTGNRPKLAVVPAGADVEPSDPLAGLQQVAKWLKGRSPFQVDWVKNRLRIERAQDIRAAFKAGLVEKADLEFHGIEL